MAARIFFIFVGISLWLTPPCLAVETGRNAALKYFQGKSKRSPQSSGRIAVKNRASYSSRGDRLLGVALGNLVATDSYDWVGSDFKGWNVSLYYQPESDGYFNTRYELDFQTYNINQEDLSKLSFMVDISFPRRLTFPVYIGVGAGPGYFFKQAQGESALALDYKAYLGLRLTQPHSQYFLQSGVKNHIHMLSDGQFVGWFITSGVAYKF